jgi:hypothetical protein
MKKNNFNSFPLTTQEIELIRSKLYSDDSDRVWQSSQQCVEISLAFLKRLFIASNFQIGFKFDCYGYWPQNKELTKWVASDGSEIECSLVTMICNYGAAQARYMFDSEPEDMEGDMIPKRMRQAEFEDTYM